MTKAELKRQKQTRETLTNILNRRLIDFKNDYLGDYVAWGVRQVELQLEDLKERHGKQIPAWKGSSKMITTDYSVSIKRTEEKLERSHLLTLELMEIANKGYQMKFERLIEKLVGFGFTPYKIKVETVADAGYKLTFLISNDEMEVHARVIYVCGSIKAPHYRFITTKRNKKK